MSDLFDKLDARRPPAPTEEKTKQPDHIQRTLDFILRWPRESISTSDLMTYGPRPKQNAEGVLKLATTLEKYGWLTKKETPKKNMRHWNIVRHPIIHPKLTTDS